MYNPCIRGWITYYSHFDKTQLRPTLQRIDAYISRWARRKFKRMRHRIKGARDWYGRPSVAPSPRRALGTMP
jgi:RNA-directed DNA polymerase